MSEPKHEHLIPTAKATLGVPGDANLSDCKQAFLWRLDEEEMLPSNDLIEAASLLGVLSRVDASFPALQSRFEHKLNQEVEEFIGDYWDLDPEKRQVEWDRLNGMAEVLPRVRLRMAGLKHGLEARIPPDPDGLFEPVIRCLYRAYLAPSTLRNFLILVIAEESNISFEDLKSRASWFKRKHPEFTEVFSFLDLNKNVEVLQKPWTRPERRREVRLVDFFSSEFTLSEKLSELKIWLGAFLILAAICAVGILTMDAVHKSSVSTKAKKISPPTRTTDEKDRRIPNLFDPNNASSKNPKDGLTPNLQPKNNPTTNNP